MSKAQPDGGDIIFTDASNNKLNHEIELYNSANGHLIAWVNLPQLSHTTDTILNMYYGNPTIGDQQKPASTWNSGYVMVQHLEETSTTVRKDSTFNHNDGTAVNGVSKSPSGKIDGADLFDGVNDYTSIPNNSSLNPGSAISVEAWINLSSTGAYINLINKGTWSQYSLRLGGAEGRTYWYVKFSDTSTANVEGYNLWKFNTWHHIVATVDTQAMTMKVYIDGVEKLSYSFGPGKSIISTSNTVSISGPTERWIKGSIDEVRISNVVRSPAWIQTSYNNQKYPATFYVEGEEETIPVEPLIVDLTPANKAKGILTSLSALSFNLTDAQSNFMNYTVTTYPNIGSGEGVNITQGRFVVNVANLQYSTTYLWSINVTDALRWTNRTLSFTTTPSTPPTQDNPTLTINSNGDLIGQNQTTADPDGNKVTNIYNWYKNGVSLTNLLLPFDTNSSTMTKDYSGYGNNGLIIRGATWTPNGKIGGAYDFNKGQIIVPGSDTLDGGGQLSEITVEHWIYLTATQGGYRRTIARIPSYEIGVTSANHVFASVWINPNNNSISGYKNVESTLSLNLTTWYHVVLTYRSGVGIILYVNGNVWKQSGPFSGNIQASGFNPLYIGWFDYFKGKIDEVRIYARSLSSAQVVRRFNETKDGLISGSTILKIETQVGEVWQCAVTPNDSYVDGITKYSNTVTT